MMVDSLSEAPDFFELLVVGSLLTNLDGLGDMGYEYTGR